MIDIIAAQRVERRKIFPRRARIHHIDQVKQRPARKNNTGVKKLRKRGGGFWRFKGFLKPLPDVPAGRENAGSSESRSVEKLVLPKEEQENSPRRRAAFPRILSRKSAKSLKKSPVLKTDVEKPAPAAAVFLWKIFPPLLLLAAAFYFLFVSNWAHAFPMPSPVSLPEDTRYERDMISYAGVAAREQPETGGEEIPLDMMETFRWHTYRVKPGDSVSKIAQDHAVSMDAVIASNGMTNAKKLYEGQELKIPNMDGIPYTIKRDDSLLKISGSMGVPLTAILDANDIVSDDISPGTVLFIPGARMKTEDLKLALGDFFRYPIRGNLSSGFG
ncbi:MAG: LysM peptidoglycan-binding domain-containing protein, partial [Treponema sp.]|nr:LysM peptidoglycan-binding domain-containing protein [Treponema sp.]